MTDTAILQFQELVWEFYAQQGRHGLPWRQPEPNGTFDPYKIMVSELMLQQTQVSRVIPKYELFIETFPNIRTLAAAELGDVLRSWQGLGYNRRAKFLWQAAIHIEQHYKGVLPGSEAELVTLPGIGPNTAGAIMAYAYDAPAVYVETNIRTVMIHHFFDAIERVTDRDIQAAVAATIPTSESARQWYWALMDYGAHLKRTLGGLNHRSASYTKQSTFQGSRRQVRGAVLRSLHEHEKTFEELASAIQDERLGVVLHDLLQEGLIQQQKDKYRL